MTNQYNHRGCWIVEIIQTPASIHLQKHTKDDRPMYPRKIKTRFCVEHLPFEASIASDPKALSGTFVGFETTFSSPKHQRIRGKEPRQLLLLLILKTTSSTKCP
jgi:hypothetical protein